MSKVIKSEYNNGQKHDDDFCHSMSSTLPDQVPFSPPNVRRNQGQNQKQKQEQEQEKVVISFPSKEEKSFKMISGSASSTIQNKLYVVNGTKIGSSTWRNSVQVYDGVMDRWTNLPSFSQQRNFCAVAVDEINDKVFVIGGCQDNQSLQSTEILHLNTLTWETLPNMNRKRSGCGAVVSNNKLIVIGGFDGKKFLSCMEVMDLTQETKEWKLISDDNVLKKPRAYFGITTTISKDKVIIIGGCTGQSFWGYNWCSDVQCMEISSSSNQDSYEWTTWKSAPLAGKCNAQLKSEKIYAMIENQAFIFDTKKQEWSAVQNSPSTEIHSMSVM